MTHEDNEQGNVPLKAIAKKLSTDEDEDETANEADTESKYYVLLLYI
ncbi:MAG: hypothetical protein ACI8RD_012905 [Bacillariaceae sp.]|jgi:hypothetical protein